MSYNSRNNKEYEIDELNIKFHLGTSLDKSGISVSEDLIQRTLDAINKESAVQTDIEDNNKLKRAIPHIKYIRSIAGVAAALLVVVGGLNVLNVLGNKGMKKDNAIDSAPEILISSDLADDVTSGDIASDRADIYNGFAMDEQDFSDNDMSAKSSDNIKESAEKILTDNVATQKSSDLIDNGQTALMSVAGVKYGFRELVPVDMDELEYIKITNNDGGSSIILNDDDSIHNFYKSMETLEFTEAVLETDTVLYQIEIKAENTYNIQVGSMIVIISEKEDTVEDNLVYTVSDGEIASKILATYFQ